MGRGFLAGLFWGGLVGLGLLFVSSLALDRQVLSLPQPEAAAVEVPGGSEFDQAREDTDPVLPDADTRPEGEQVGMAAVPEDAVETPPSFDTTALEVPTPSVGEAGELSQAPETSEAPDAPEVGTEERPSDTTSGLVVPDDPGQAPDAAEVAAQPEAPATEDAAEAEASSGDDQDLSATDLAVLQATETDQTLGAETSTAPAITTEDNAPAAPLAPSLGDDAALPAATDGEDTAPRLPQVSSPSQPEVGTTNTTDIASAPSQPSAPEVPQEQPEEPQPESQDQSLLQKVDELEDQAETVETDRLPRIGDEPDDAANDDGESGSSGLPTIRRLGNESEAAEAETEEGEAEVQEQEASTDEAAVDGPAIVAFGTPFSNDDDTPLMSLVLVQDGSDALTSDQIAGLPETIAFAVKAGDGGAGAAAAQYRASGREVVMIPSLPEGARPQDVEQALRVNFEAIPEAVAIMDVSGSSFQSDRAAVEQVVDAISDSGHGLITYPRGLNTAHQSATRAGVPAGLIFRRLDGSNETVEQIRRTLDRAAFRARNDEAVILVGTTAPDTVTAIMEWAAGNRARSVTIAPISAALLNE